MKSNASFADRFMRSLDRVPSSTRERVNRHGGLSEDRLLSLLMNPEDHRVKAPVALGNNEVLSSFNDEECEALGSEALHAGSVAYCVLAGGAGTRIGEPKALLGIPGGEETLLSLKLRKASGSGPIWVITNHALFDRVSEHVAGLRDIDQSRIRVLEQYESYRLTPDNQVKFSGGAPDLYPCGHGDVFSVLFRSGVLSNFSSVGRCVQVVNVDNAVSSLNAVSIGRHLTCGHRVSFEVVRREVGDTGGVLCDAFGAKQIVEGFRLTDTDPEDFGWLSTNTFTFDSYIMVEPIGKRWHRVQKLVGGELLIQHERLSQEITEAYDTAFIEVEKNQRFYPIKNSEQLANFQLS